MIFKFKLIGVSKANPAVSFVVKDFVELDQAERAQAAEMKAYTHNGISKWDFVVQNIR